MHANHRITVFVLACSLAHSTLVAAAIEPLVRVVDLDRGETRQVTLHDDTRATVTLLELIEDRDSVCNAVRKAQVTVNVNGQVTTLVSSTYHLPTAAGGVQIDCPITKGYVQDSSTARRVYERAGEYSEIVKVTDSAGNAAYDFAVVYVIDREHPERVPPAIHGNYHPTFGLRAGDELTFKVRSFTTRHGEEVWDFGDGSDPVRVQSDGNADQHNPAGYAVTQHRYRKAGDYIVTVRRSDEHGCQAIAHLHVRID